MTLMARYSGTCHDCGGRWEPGDLIRSEGPAPGDLPAWQHAVCPDDPDLPDGPYPMACGHCWLVHPVGACDR